MINSKWKSGISGDKNEAIEEEDENEMHDLSSDSDNDRTFKLPQVLPKMKQRKRSSKKLKKGIH